MALAEAIRDVLECDIPAAFEMFGKVLDPQWTDTALVMTGTASLRRRTLNAQTVVWLVIGMALFRDRAISEVIAHLGLVLPSQQPTGQDLSLAPSAILQARHRLGSPGNLPKRLASLHETMASLLVLPERRTEQRYERHVKIKMSSFKPNPGRPVAKESK